MDTLFHPLSLIVGALIASITGLVTHWLERGSDGKKLKLKKIERLCAIYSEYHVNSSVLIKEEAGEITGSEYKQFDKDVKKVMKMSFAKTHEMRAIIYIHFPELKLDFDNLIERQGEALNILDKLGRAPNPNQNIFTEEFNILTEEFKKKYDVSLRESKKFPEKILKEAEKYTQPSLCSRLRKRLIG